MPMAPRGEPGHRSLYANEGVRASPPLTCPHLDMHVSAYLKDAKSGTEKR